MGFCLPWYFKRRYTKKQKRKKPHPKDAALSLVINLKNNQAKGGLN